MKKMNVFALVLVIAMMMSALGGCSAEVEALEPTPVPEATEEPAAEATPEPAPEGPVLLSEWDIRPFVWFNDLYIMEGTEVSDYLQFVSLIDEEAVTGVTVDAEGIDTSVVGDYDLTYTATVNRDLYDAYIAAQDSLVAYEVPADEASEVWKIDNVEYAGLEAGTEYTILAKYLVTEAVAAEDSDSDAEIADEATIGNVPPALLRDAEGAIVYSEVSFTPESESGELQVEHTVDAALIPEGMAAVPEYFLLAADDEADASEEGEAIEPMDAAEEVAEIVEDAEAVEDVESAEDAEEAADVEDASDEATNVELVEVVRVVHVVSAEDFDAITTSGGVVSVGDGVATEVASVVEAVAGDEAEAEAQEETSGQTTNTNDTAANANNADNTNAANTGNSGNSGDTSDKANAGNTSTGNSGSAGGTSTVTTPKPTATPKPSSGITTGGGTSTKPAHTHSYTSAVTTAATCTSAGVRTYTCSCGASYTESIPATGHSWTTETVSDGYYSSEITGWNTVHHDGYYECLNCGKTFSTEDDAAWHEVEVCKYSYTYVYAWDEDVPIYSDVWHDTSYTVKKCSICGATQ